MKLVKSICFYKCLLDVVCALVIDDTVIVNLYWCSECTGGHVSDVVDDTGDSESIQCTHGP